MINLSNHDFEYITSNKLIKLLQVQKNNIKAQLNIVRADKCKMQNKFKTQYASQHNKYQFIKKSSITFLKIQMKSIILKVE